MKCEMCGKDLIGAKHSGKIYCYHCVEEIKRMEANKTYHLTLSIEGNDRTMVFPITEQMIKTALNPEEAVGSIVLGQIEDLKLWVILDID